MDPRDLRRVLKQQPFCPLRFHVADGTVFEIRHPDMARLRRTAILLSMPAEADGERHALVPLGSIVWVEIIIRPPKDQPKETN